MQGGHAPDQHKASLGIYLAVFAALMVMTAITVWVSTVNLGPLNTPVALAIAIVKMSLVILFFMHVIHSSRLTWVVVIGAFLWLSVLFVLTFTDYLSRGLLVY